ncbi:hypothetical protein MHB77_12785 [Paenibacillus sp. FSL K6-3166]|uniref:hypothetical protein n=1 Tax=Paenibacillus TaxID=44249 RepID=UPI00096D33BF|nr:MULTISPECIES: hypothetical protein [Paenibacillus]OMD04383.1 hypothetical protein BJP46_13500 [Paenibacillus odorifer]OZQ85417.1 hypothetical protein CA598_21070 [Paenibacillus sp. VTT E-133291]
MIELYVLLSIPFGWKFISKLQRNITVFTTISNYIVYKIILSVFVGWAVTPFYLIGYLFKLVRMFNPPSSTK